MVNFVGIDQSYTGLGLTYLDPAALVEHTSVTAFPASKFRSEGDRLEHIKLHVSDNVTQTSVVAMEGYASGAKFGREMAGELGGAIKSMLWEEYRIVPWIVAPTSLKKFVLGASAGKGKNLMLLGVYKKWGVEFDNDNAADSYALAKITYALTYPDTVEHKYEREVLDVLLKPKPKTRKAAA